LQFARQSKSVMRYVIDAISDLARITSNNDGREDYISQEENFDPQWSDQNREAESFEPDPGADHNIDDPNQQVLLSQLLDSSFAYVEQLIDSSEFSEAIEFTKELIDRFHTERLRPGLEQIFNNKGAAWLEAQVQQLTSARELVAMELTMRQEKSRKQLSKLPKELQSEITYCMSVPATAGARLWPTIREKASNWLAETRSKDIDLDRFVEALGKSDKELRRLDAIEGFFADKLEAALAIANVIPESIQTRAPEAEIAMPDSLAVTTACNAGSESDKLSLSFSEYQRVTTEKILYALVHKNLPELKQLITGFTGTPSDFNTVGRAIEELLKPFGITVTGAFGPHWAILSLETIDYQCGLQFCLPSGKIAGYLRGTAFSPERSAQALALIARLLSGKRIT